MAQGQGSWATARPLISTMDDLLTVHCPIYLLTSGESCWKCGTMQRVNALGSHVVSEAGDELNASDTNTDLILLTNIAGMPPEVFAYIAQRNPRYVKRHSRTAGEVYFANTCECGAHFGDFHLFAQPEGAFFPVTDEAAKSIQVAKMPFTGSLKFDCSPSMGIGDFILKHATRIDVIASDDNY